MTRGLMSCRHRGNLLNDLRLDELRSRALHFAFSFSSTGMWVEILCGVVLYQLCRRFFSDDDIIEFETSDSNAIFSVAERIEKIYDGKVYVGLQIPDADTSQKQDIDIVTVTKDEAVVIAVKNFSGFVSIDSNGIWVCVKDGSQKLHSYPDPVAENNKKIEVLGAYLEQRGVVLPDGYFSGKVILPNPKFCTLNPGAFTSDVITYAQWAQLKPEPRTMFSGWLTSAFRSGKKGIQESMQGSLDFILSTAPMYDRLEIKGNKHLLGVFHDFKGKVEDVQALKNIRRSKVYRVVVQKFSLFGLAPSKVQVLYYSRDYRNEKASSSEWREVSVRSSTEIIFQPKNDNKQRKFKLASVSSMSLSA